MGLFNSTLYENDVTFFLIFRGRWNSANASCISTLVSKPINTKTHRNVVLPDVVYGSETWFLALREDRRLRVFEKRVLRKRGMEGGSNRGVEKTV